jgi:hypothetical protein
MAMAAAHCAVCSGAMVLTVAEIDPANGTFRSSVDADDGEGSPLTPRVSA